MRSIIVLVVVLLSCVVGLDVKDCDVVVAGGSTASLAAAWTAANVLNSSTVCLTDPTDWLGGQLTASAVSAIDYGRYNDPSPYNANLPLPFRLLGETFEGNPGGCWVSQKCFLPQDLLRKFITPHTLTKRNLRVYTNTVITKTDKNSQGVITGLTAVRRTAVSGTTGWETLMSLNVQDWYSSSNSTKFSKEVITFSGFKVAIEATEFGDVLMTADLPTAQGIEYPNENSTNFLDVCGQANTIDFYMRYLSTKPVNPWTPPPGCPQCTGKNEVDCCHFGADPGADWVNIWTYRRSFANGSHSIRVLNQGDISLQNYGSQDSEEYLFVDLETGKQQARSGKWAGGLNLTALAYSEQRAYGWYWAYYKNATETVKPYLIMVPAYAGTGTGLAKMPYLRDTRRALHGLGGFRLTQPQLSGEVSPSQVNYGYHFADTIGIGYYNVDIHTGRCPQKLPAYLSNRSISPYYIPFRALTVQESPNLLVAGKNMAQTFHANAATRLHPEEWVTGSAAGAAASLMVNNKWTSTQEVYNNIKQLQDLLVQLGQPLEWDIPSRK